MENEKLPRMRTIPQAYAELKAIDPNTGVSMRGLRKIIGSGIIPTFEVSPKKILINFDMLLDLLSGKSYNDSATGAYCQKER